MAERFGCGSGSGGCGNGRGGCRRGHNDRLAVVVVHGGRGSPCFEYLLQLWEVQARMTAAIFAAAAGHVMTNAAATLAIAQPKSVCAAHGPTKLPK